MPGPFVPTFGPPGSLEIVLPPKARSGPPGERLIIAGSFTRPCALFLLHFDGTFITDAKPSANGYSFSDARFKIPYDARPGPHTISAHCNDANVSAAGLSAIGNDPVGTLPFTVDPSAPDVGSDHRSGFARSVPDPTTVVNGIKHNRELVGQNILLALILLLMITFPAELFNSTLEENYEEVQGWFKRLRRVGRGLGRHLRKLPSMVSVALFAIVGGLVYGFLDPAFGADRDSLINVAGMAAGILAITLTFDLTAVRSLRRRYPASTRLRILPGTMVVAALCVLLSRVVDFSPGYFYGVIAGWVISAETSHREEGRATAIGSTAMMVMSVGAWLLW
ncbi:MAG TPA: FGLLP motif-containing membrane protein, partial [Actinomycetota bacterium]|nr:FGLLP motif-containing membrane protein [Actinomycetota bacterium]